MLADPDRECIVPYDLRAANATDDEFWLGLFAATHGEELKARVAVPSLLDQIVRTQFHAQRQSYFARFPGAAASIIVSDGVPVGLWWIAESGEEYRILDIAIIPEFRNRRIGTSLVTRLLAVANRSGKPVRSSVVQTNAGSIRFHYRMGFQVSSSDDVYLQMEYRPVPDPSK